MEIWHGYIHTSIAPEPRKLCTLSEPYTSDALYQIRNRPHGPGRACFASSAAVVLRYDAEASTKLWPGYRRCY